MYNEIDEYAARWIENLSAAGVVAGGNVDRRSINEVEPSDVRSAVQFHAFAGIGVWSYALRLAGWPDVAPVWTGSCPCQPFSTAGRGRGLYDQRHLWPSWFRLIRECRPPVVFGEQVASPDGLSWLSAVRADLEGEGYAFGAADLCAAGVGAPHMRQRLYFGAARLGDAANGGLLDTASRLGEHPPPGRPLGDAPEQLRVARQGRSFVPWERAEWLYCRDGKLRPAEPGVQPLADGTPDRVGHLRAYGNAIVPQVAAAFVSAFRAASNLHPTPA